MLGKPFYLANACWIIDEFSLGRFSLGRVSFNRAPEEFASSKVAINYRSPSEFWREAVFPIRYSSTRPLNSISKPDQRPRNGIIGNSFLFLSRHVLMVHGYHAIFGTYGYWLPNDPRGSWSDFVSKWELVQFGKATKSAERKVLTENELRNQREAKKHLKYPEVVFDGEQALAVASGFKNAVRKSGFTVWACSILPQHVHLVLGRHSYEVEQMINLMKGEATKQLRAERLDPLAGLFDENGKRPSPWAAGKWKVFLDTEEAIENAIHYVVQNPMDEGKPQQNWSFVEGFRGLDKGWVTYR